MSDVEPNSSSDIDDALTGFLDEVETEGRLAELKGSLGVWGASIQEPGTLLGEFRLQRPIGRGGMGVVWKASWEAADDLEVAVKILSRTSPNALIRFEREIAAIRKLEHDNIVRVLGSGVHIGLPYFAMELAAGLGLDRLVQQLARDGHPPRNTEGVRNAVRLLSEQHGHPPEERSPGWSDSYADWVARFGAQLAAALQHAHDRGVVHRDVKPANINVTSSGQPVLLDFGLASLVGNDTLTQDGDFFGSLAYASPEQVRGARIDPRGDVYALGATLYELLTLRRPFYGATREELRRRVLHDELGSFGSDVPRELQVICLKALRKGRRARYATAEDMRHDLVAYADRKPIKARPPGVLHAVRRSLRRHPFIAIALLTLTVSIIGMRTIRHLQASTRVNAGRVALDEYLAAAQQCREQHARLQRLFAEHRRGDDVDLRDLETLRGRMRQAQPTLDVLARRSESELQAAFHYVAGQKRARRLLAGLHAARLRQALFELQDVYEPARIAGIERDLQSLVNSGESSHLLDPVGTAQLDSIPRGARVEVRDGVGTVIENGTTPLDLDLPEGLYFASFELSEFAPARLPFLVRRDACYVNEDALPTRRRAVEMLRPDQLPDGFVYVPSGWALVEDDPPVWDWVEGFQIQRDEVTNRLYLEWIHLLRNAGTSVLSNSVLETLSNPNDPAYKPRYFSRPQDFHVRVDPTTQDWNLIAGMLPEWPVRGLTAMEMEHISNAVGHMLWPSDDQWASLPTASEWIRAGRGEDGRPFPWGNEAHSKDRCVSYGSAGSFDSAPTLFPVGGFPSDVSPFGVRDMAGSIAEITRDLAGPLPGNYRVCGGSYRVWRSSEFMVTAWRSVGNVPESDVGFRMVRRRLPSWASGSEEIEVFTDDFDRPDGPITGNEWLRFFSEPLGLRTNPHERPQVEIRGRKLVFRDRKRTWSEASAAWRRLHLPDWGYSIRVTIEAEFDDSASAKQMFFTLRESCLPSSSGALKCGLGANQSFVLSFDLHPVGAGRGSSRLDPAGPNTFEVRAYERHLELRAWTAGGLPAEPVATMERPAKWKPQWFVMEGVNGGPSVVRYDNVTVELIE